ncbi:MAG TPA: glycosyltransferase family 2 protein [Vicinamibacterales bacterium]|nr:glycosyltransferase family 2 protein [Vicinamibacterales bacterium]
MSPLLSIIVPFFNSTGKADRLLTTLAGINEPDVELIFVDDGSSDGTPAYLDQWRSRMHVPCTAVRQENKGPGAARNCGLDLAAGQFVWYVDADDDINPAVVPVLRQLRGRGYDFIDFNVQHFTPEGGPIRPSRGMRAGALNLPEGEYTAADVTRLALLRTIGWPWPKILDRQFLQRNGVRFPEYCVYEELPSLFWYPLIVDRFYKSDLVAYFHHQDGESITRSAGRKGPRFYDRLFTSGYAVAVTARYPRTDDERRRIHDKFTNIFLIHTIEMLWDSGDWPSIPRVMRFYREEARRMAIQPSPASYLLRRSQLVALSVPWLLSYLYPSQRHFFERLHHRAWSRPVSFAAVQPYPQCQ